MEIELKNRGVEGTQQKVTNSAHKRFAHQVVAKREHFAFFLCSLHFLLETWDIYQLIDYEKIFAEFRILSMC